MDVETIVNRLNESGLFTTEEVGTVKVALTASTGTRYKLLSDGDGHDFVVPVDKEGDFNAHLESVYDGSGDEIPMPEGVYSLGGSPSMLTFSLPAYRGKNI